jgi:hypothetical protein
MKYDVIIVGAGIAGLYAATRLQKKMGPNARILVLEKHKRKWLGGRTWNEMFRGVNVVTGAGIGRKAKDKLLIKLLKEYKVSHNEFMVDKQYASTIINPVDTRKIVRYLQQEYEKAPFRAKGKTFKQFAIEILGNQLYNKYMECAEYTDYENADVYETLYNYGLDDNESGWTGMMIPWQKLVEKMADDVSIKYSQDVIQIIKKSDDHIIIKTEDGSLEGSNEQSRGKTYECAKLIIATTITSLRKLLPYHREYKSVEGQPFLRLYGKFEKESAEIMAREVPKMTIVPGPLKKMIPMGQGVYMIGYTDNEMAERLKDKLKNTEMNREFMCRLIEKSLGIRKNMLKMKAMRDYYWPVGTHYYKPEIEKYNSLSNPEPNIYVVGEMVSKKQGWVEGALESVETIL